MKRAAATSATAPPITPLLYTAKQACEQLNIHRITLYRHIREGRLNAVRLGHLVMIPSAELSRFVAQLEAVR